MKILLMVDGILIIDKPAGLTSHDVVAKCRRILGTKKVGHTGTLDPFATGVMVILVGQATRLAQFLDKDRKEYEAVIRFGFETDTGDLTGEPKSAPSEKMPTVAELRKSLEAFLGEQMQTPPMYSAKKIGGRKLYELARKGEEVERAAASVNISALELLSQKSGTDFSVRVVCSAGTYIRVLAEDIGKSLGCGAHLAELRRTRAGKFGIESAVTLEALDAAASKEPFLIQMNEALSDMPFVTIPEARLAPTRNGMSSRIHDTEFPEGTALRMVDVEGNLLAIGTFRREEKSVQPRIVLM